MKITILYDTWEGAEEYPGASSEKGSRRRRRPKLDREEIFDSLTKLGHEPAYHELDGRDATLMALAKLQTDLVFNLTEAYDGDDSKEMHVAAFLDLVGKRYTGSGPHALAIAQDKALTKKVIRFHDLYTPYFAVSYKGKVDLAQDIRFPLIVKPLKEDGSKGVDAASVVNTIKELMERIDFVEQEFDSPSLIEEFIEGREIYAAVLGNDPPEALPLVELDLSKLPDEVPKIASYDVKFETTSDAYRKTKSGVVEDLGEEIAAAVQNAAVSAYRALGLRDYARIDVRLTPEGRVYIIEANPNPWLSSSAEFFMAAKASGRNYTRMIEEIVDSALAR